jgi:adenine deaminase
MDHFLRKAISEGMDSMTAIQLATINPSNYMGMENEIGSISPGRLADVLLLSDLGKVRIERILVGGREIGQRPSIKPFRYPRRLTMTIKLKRRFVSSDFAFESRRGKEVDVVVIRMLEETLLTSKETKRLKTSQGVIEVSGDVLYASVAERHRRTGNIGRGFIAGLGSLDGALAQTIAHDSHNIIVVGSNPLDMLIAAREVSAMQGGIALSSRGKLVASLALSVAGLMSKESAEDVAEKKELLENQSRRLGLRVKSPVTTLSFLSLPVIPAIRLTDKGLFDVNRGMFIDPVAK